MTPNSRASGAGPIVARGLAVAHDALVGALFLALLHVPLQVASAIQQGAQNAAFVPGEEPDPGYLALAVALSGVTFLLGLAVVFVFPLIQGGILGLVRNRLEYPDRPPAPFWSYGRTHYLRLLGSQGLMLLASLVVVVPAACVAVGLTLQSATNSSGQPPAVGEINRQLIQHPAMIAVLVLGIVMMAASGTIYWVANCRVVAEGEGTVTAWRKAARFCRENFTAVLALWLVNFAAGVATAPLVLLGQLGVVTEWWALVMVGIVYAALIGYWGVVLAGLCMSLYLARRQPAVPEGDDSRLEPVGAGSRTAGVGEGGAS
jgi:hypothetical protein